MFLNTLIHRKISNLLRPWITHEPELELRLGLYRSEATINDIHFDASALNEFVIEDPNRFRFKELTIDTLTLRLTNWLSPSFEFQIHGLNIILAVGEVEDEIEEGTGGKKPKVRDTSEEELESVLAEIDPEGCALHDIIKRISNFSGSSWKNSLYSSTLGRCSLNVTGIDVLVQSPSPDNPSLLSLGVKDFSLRPQRGLKVFFEIDIQGVGIELRSKSHLSTILPPTDFRTCITLYKLQLTDIVISVPSLCFSFSPTDLSVILLFCLLSSRKSHYTRNGLQLWRIAASKMSHLISDPRLSLNRVVGDVCQWRLYLLSYQNVLSLVGYPLEDRIKKSATTVIRDGTFADSLKYQLRVISDIEKKLPAHAIVQARRIARQEAVLRAQELQNIDQKTQRNSFIWKFFHILALAWDAICSLFFSLSTILLLQSRPKKFDHLKAIPESSLPRLCISLEVGNFSLSTLASNGVLAPAGKHVLEDGISHKDVVSFQFLIDAFSARFSQNISEKCFSFAFGNFKLLSTSTVNDSSNSYKYLSGQQKNKSNNVKSVLWTEPAQFICFDEGVRINPGSVGETSMTYLECLIGSVWSNWKNLHQNVDGNMREIMEDPFIICESKFHLTNQSLEDNCSGMWNCGLVVGKVNIFLEYVSILSMSVLFGQFQNALSWASNQTVVSHSGTLSDGLLAVGLNGMFKSYMKRTQMGIVGLIPEENIQIGALIAGPLIQVYVKEEDYEAVDSDICHVTRKNHMCFSVHVDDIDLLVLPDVNALLALPSRQSKMIDTQLKDCQLKVRKEVSGRNDISKLGIPLSGYLKVNGLKSYIGEPSEVSGGELLTLGPTTIALSSLRKNAHSFGTTNIGFFSAFSLMASGVSATLFLDELFVLVKVVSGLFYSSRHAFDSIRVMGGQEEFKKLMKYEERCSSRRKLTALIDTNILCVVNTSFELNSMRILLPGSYRSFEPERHANGSSRLKLGSDDIPNCGVNVWVEQIALEASFEEEKAELYCNLAQLHTVLFKSSPEILDLSDQTKFEKFVPASSCLSDASLSHLKFSLCVVILEESELDGSLPAFTDISTSHGSLMDLPVNSTLEIVSERLRTQSTSWLLAHLTLSDVFIVGCPVKNISSRGHNTPELEITFSIAGPLETITCQSQGGFIYLDSSAVVLLIQIFNSYIHWIKHLYSAPPSSKERVDQHGEDMACTNINPSPQTMDFHKLNWELLETFTLDISQLCLALLASDGTGRLDELLFEMDTHLDLRLGNVTRQSSLVISKLSILSSSHCHKIEEQILEIRSPYRLSNLSFETCNSENSDPSATIDLMESKDHISSSNPQNYILKELSIFLMIEWPVKRNRTDSLYLNETWAGNGSTSGLELIISLRELQVRARQIRHPKMISAIVLNDS